MKICVFGNKDITSSLLLHLVQHDYRVSTLVFVREDATDLRLISGYDSKLQNIAEKLQIQRFACKSYSLNKQSDIDFFHTQKFDLGICLGWQRLIPDELLGSFKHGVFGWHGSMFRFPNGRGRSPINWSIRLGGHQIYHNLFRYNAGVDDGLVYMTSVIKIGNDDYISDVQDHALVSIKRTVLSLLSDIATDRLVLSLQPSAPFISFPKLNEESGWLEVTRLRKADARNIVRSCSRPFPGAFVRSENHDFKARIWRADVADEDVAFGDDENFRVTSQRCYLKFADGVLVSEDFELLSPSDKAPSQVV